MLRILHGSVLIFFVGTAVFFFDAYRVTALGQQDRAIQLVPERDVVFSGKNQPLWKQTWDNARALSRKEKFDEAVTTYESLLELKPNIDEARWELTSILLHLEQWQKASRHLNIILARGDRKIRYLTAQAEIALHTNNERQAEILYRQLGSMKLTQRYQVKVLDGLSLSLIGQKKYAEALPYARGLLVRYPDNKEYIKRTAFLYRQVGETDIAGEILQQACLKRTADMDMLQGCVAVAVQRGRTRDAEILWQEIIEHDPQNISAHKALIKYYRDVGNNALELEYLERLFMYEQPDATSVQRMITLAFREDRIKEALIFCCSLSERYPQDKGLLKLHRQAMRRIAMIVIARSEKNGLKHVWNDLSQYSAYRFELLKAMATVLRKKREYTELADILLVALDDIPEQDPLRNELKQLLKEQGRMQDLARCEETGAT